jgi:hypothetical protein
VLKAGEVKALLVVKLDRLTRSVVDLGSLVDGNCRDICLVVWAAASPECGCSSGLEASLGGWRSYGAGAMMSA